MIDNGINIDTLYARSKTVESIKLLKHMGFTEISQTKDYKNFALKLNNGANPAKTLLINTCSNPFAKNFLPELAKSPMNHVKTQNSGFSFDLDLIAIPSQIRTFSQQMLQVFVTKVSARFEREECKS